MSSSSAVSLNSLFETLGEFKPDTSQGQFLPSKTICGTPQLRHLFPQHVVLCLGNLTYELVVWIRRCFLATHFECFDKEEDTYSFHVSLSAVEPARKSLGRAAFFQQILLHGKNCLRTGSDVWNHPPTTRHCIVLVDLSAAKLLVGWN